MWIKTIPHMNYPAEGENEPVISRPSEEAIPDMQNYWLAHYGPYLTSEKRRRIELLEEYDVDKFWCQFVEPTQRPEPKKKRVYPFGQQETTREEPT
jgi:hypothetical protein